MRGSLEHTGVRLVVPGIIPAHAGLTILRITAVCCARDHPRACGAHDYLMADERGRWGSSPRMRGSLPPPAFCPPAPGIIPAHAGLTNYEDPAAKLPRDHPRACGAHRGDWIIVHDTWGSSPRMRGSLLRKWRNSIATGIIPAHAGLTIDHNSDLQDYRDHPRACGAHHLCAKKHIAKQGSSPRMRGSQMRAGRQRGRDGIIPAHAGLTMSSLSFRNPSGDHPRACGAHGQE